MCGDSRENKPGGGAVIIVLCGGGGGGGGGTILCYINNRINFMIVYLFP